MIVGDYEPGQPIQLYSTKSCTAYAELKKIGALNHSGSVISLGGLIHRLGWGEAHPLLQHKKIAKIKPRCFLWLSRLVGGDGGGGDGGRGHTVIVPCVRQSQWWFTLA